MKNKTCITKLPLFKEWEKLKIKSGCEGNKKKDNICLIIRTSQQMIFVVLDGDNLVK